ncbi:MAG: membrane protein insertion efficiency factor YidD, partial [Clostridia bacterium]|nr:membrane protein insertion efficiency factor YidD [Clostridia bacterium]
MKSGNFIIQYYKQFINPVIGGKCRHIPSWSAYMGQA